MTLLMANYDVIDLTFLFISLCGPYTTVVHLWSHKVAFYTVIKCISLPVGYIIQYPNRNVDPASAS